MDYYLKSVERDSDDDLIVEYELKEVSVIAGKKELVKKSGNEQTPNNMLVFIPNGCAIFMEKHWNGVRYRMIKGDFQTIFFDNTDNQRENAKLITRKRLFDLDKYLNDSE